MGHVLVTGASGFVGSHLVPGLSRDHDLVAMSRRSFEANCATIRGSYASARDLKALDNYQIDSVVHLAAEIDGSPERETLEANVLGTRTLVRYLVDRGCRHFVLASSIAASGAGREDFVPRELPIPDDHPCDAIDAYGLSKALMEDLAFYFHRCHPELEITLFRLGVVLSPDARERYGQYQLLAETRYPFAVGGGVIALEDVVDAFTAAAQQRLGPGARRINLVGANSRTHIPIPEALGSALGDRVSAVDTHYYERPGREMASLYSTERLWDAYGFRPSIDVRTLEEPAWA